jgi:hypothetical protein
MDNKISICCPILFYGNCPEVGQGLFLKKKTSFEFAGALHESKIILTIFFIAE